MLQLVCEDFREMYPNRAENYCCTGGGGAMSMSEYTPRRLKSAKIKADQLKATGAEVVVTSCHNCVDGLSDLIKHYKLGMPVTQLVNLVANALVPQRFTIPVEAPPEPVAAPAAGLEGQRILVCDDEPDFVTFVSTLLEDNGAVVMRAFSGEEAMEAARKDKPNLMTLDISLPGKSGVEIFEEIRNDSELKRIPICIITGKPELRKLIYDRAVTPPEGYVDKPITKDTLLLNIRKILKLSHQDQPVAKQEK